MKSSTRSALAAAALAIVLSSHSSNALTSSSTVAVSATVAANCTIQTGTLDFGAYDPLNTAALDATGSFTVTCVKGTSYQVQLGTGSNASGAQRRMKNPVSGDFLNYEIYRDSGHAGVWGSTIGTNTSGGVSTSKAAVTMYMYGQVTALQDVSTGSYADSVASTVNF